MSIPSGNQQMSQTDVTPYHFCMLQSLQESLSKEFKQQLREAQKKHEEQMNTAESKWKKEKSELRSKVRRELQEQVRCG